MAMEILEPMMTTTKVKGENLTNPRQNAIVVINLDIIVLNVVQRLPNEKGNIMKELFLTE